MLRSEEQDLEKRMIRASVAYIWLAVLFLVTLVVAPLMGSTLLSPTMWFSFSGAGMDGTMFWQIRVPRLLLAFLAGSGLSICGMSFQTVFRNALATPFTLGTSSGASLGATLYLRFFAGASMMGGLGIALFSFGGAVLSVIIVYFLTRIRARLSVSAMLLAGVATSFSFSSIILFLQYTSDFHSSFQIVRWLMGALDVVGYDALRIITPVVLLGTAAMVLIRSELNLLLTGELLAHTRGVDVRKVIWITFFLSSLMIGVIVSVCGPIGFVGMMAPHICRLLVGWNHRVLIPATFVFGGVFLVWCDVVSRILLAPQEIPVGIITAMLGGPFFIWLLTFRTREGEGAV